MKPDKIVIHCSASEWGTSHVIDLWHRERGWKGIGYHVDIMNGFPTADHYKRNRLIHILDGVPEMGRPLDADEDLEADEMGAHCYGYNASTLAVCLIGDKTFTRSQITMLVKVVRWLQVQFRIDTRGIVGHCEMPTAGGKTCPNLDMGIVRSLIEAKSEGMRLLKAIPNLKQEVW